MKRRFVLVAALLLFAISIPAFACPTAIKCSLHHNATCYFTGRTEAIAGHLVGYYHCPAGDHDLSAVCD